MNNRRAYRNIGLVMVVGGIAYFLIRGMMNRKRFTEISEKIGGPVGSGTGQFNKWFDPSYHQSAANGRFMYNGQDVGLVKKMTHAKVNEWGDKIYTAKGYIYDNEDTALGAFREMPDAIAVSQTSDKFQKEYGRDLLGYIQTYFNKTQLNDLYKILETKPPYRRTTSITETIIS